MANMLAYPGRTFGQLYHRFFRRNDLADGRSSSAAARRPRGVRVPVLSIAGEGDGIAPRGAVHHVARAAAQRAGGADRERARRPSRRADRRRRARRLASIDDFLAARRAVPRGRRPRRRVTAAPAADRDSSRGAAADYIGGRMALHDVGRPIAADPRPLSRTAPPAATADDTSIIGPGTTAGGIDLSTLTITEAAAKLDPEVTPKLLAPVTLRIGHRRFQLGGARAQVRLDALRTPPPRLLRLPRRRHRTCAAARRPRCTAPGTTAQAAPPPTTPPPTTPPPRPPPTPAPVAAHDDADHDLRPPRRGRHERRHPVPDRRVTYSRRRPSAWANKCLRLATRRPRRATLHIGLTRGQVRKASAASPSTRRGSRAARAGHRRPARRRDALREPARRPRPGRHRPLAAARANSNDSSPSRPATRPSPAWGSSRTFASSKSYGIAVGMAGSTRRPASTALRSTGGPGLAVPLRAGPLRSPAR